MTALSPQQAVRAGGGRHRLRAFGLTVDVDWPVPGSRSVDTGGDPVRSATTVRRVAREQFDAAWAADAECVIDGRWLVERTEDGYQIACREPGRFLVSADGSTVVCESGTAPTHVQERFLVAQILPLVAVLRGFEPLHASAVGVGGAAIAFTGPSGTGKTTLTSRLVLRGAGFMTDDVLALEPGPEAPLAHSGPPFMAVAEDDRSLVEALGRVGTFTGSSDKLNVSLPTVDRALPLRTVYHLERGPRLEIATVGGDLVRRLLEGVFVPYLVTPERLRRQLDMAQLLGERVRHFRFQVPRTTGVDVTLDALQMHVRETTQ